MGQVEGRVAGCGTGVGWVVVPLCGVGVLLVMVPITGCGCRRRGGQLGTRWCRPGLGGLAEQGELGGYWPAGCSGGAVFAGAPVGDPPEEDWWWWPGVVWVDADLDEGGDVGEVEVSEEVLPAVFGGDSGDVASADLGEGESVGPAAAVGVDAGVARSTPLGVGLPGDPLLLSSSDHNLDDLEEMLRGDIAIVTRCRIVSSNRTPGAVDFRLGC